MNNNHHPQSNIANINLDVILFTEGLVNQSPVQFLLDSGAAVSVIKQESIPKQNYNDIIETNTLAVSANGTPLNVVGQIKLSVLMEQFSCDHNFVVIKGLTVDCLLGANFLKKHEAILDCQSGTLVLGAHTIPIHTGHTHTDQTQHMSVALQSNVEIPGRSIQLITCKINGCLSDVAGFIEPSNTTAGLPKHVCVARSLSKVMPNNEVILQIMNVSPSPVKMYKGMRLGCITPVQNILVVEKGGQPAVNIPPVPQVNLETSDLSPAEKARLLDLLTEFADVFVEKGPGPGGSHVVKHSITTTGLPIRQPLKRMPVALRDTVKEEVAKMLQQGVVRPSTSPWSSPVVMVKKKDNTWRFCVDYRKLNAVTHQDAYPLPRMDETLESLAGSVYFTTLDLAAGYWQVEIEEGSKEKTAFSTTGGHYEFNVMPFGLTNAPATFQ